MLLIRLMKSKSICLFLILSVAFLNRCRNITNTETLTLVAENNIVNSVIDSMSSMSLGNGHFIFSTDITGLQTFPDFYSDGTPLITWSDWSGVTENTPGRNSYRYQLGTIGLRILKKNGKEISVNDIGVPVQILNMSAGEIDSRFSIEDIPVHLKTVCHPDYDIISVKIISDLIGKRRLSIKIDFSDRIPSFPGTSYGSSRMNTTEVVSDTNNLLIFDRSRNNDKYKVMIWLNDAHVINISQNIYYLEPDGSDSTYSFSCQFLNNPEDGRIQDFGETETASRDSWEKFWSTIGNTDLRKIKGAQSKQLTADLIRSLYYKRLHSFLNEK